MTLLRQYYDQYNQEFEQKTQEAEEKSKHFDDLSFNYQQVLRERDDFYKAHTLLESKVQD